MEIHKAFHSDVFDYVLYFPCQPLLSLPSSDIYSAFLMLIARSFLIMSYVLLVREGRGGEGFVVGERYRFAFIVGSLVNNLDTLAPPASSHRISGSYQRSFEFIGMCSYLLIGFWFTRPIVITVFLWCAHGHMLNAENFVLRSF